MHQATFYRTIAEWNIIYRKLECFPHPNAYVQCGKRPLPRLLEMFPDAKDQIVAFGLKNLATLTIESVLDLIVSTVIPRLALQWKKEEDTTSNNSEEQLGVAVAAAETLNEDRTLDPKNHQEMINESFLNAHRLKLMSFSTAWHWMCLLDFKYNARRKSFYVDGHECEDFVASQQTFCKT